MTYEQLRQAIAALRDQQVENVLREIFGENAGGNAAWDFACRSLAISGGVEYLDTYWDDLKVPLTQTRQGATAKPDFDTTNVGFLFPQNDATEILYFITQLPHKYKQGTILKPHIHWQQSAATAVTWSLDYKLFLPNSAVPADFTTITGDTPVFDYDSGNLHQITPLDNIAGVAGVSALMIGKLSRNDNTTTGDVLAFDLDFHLEIDSPGSREEYTK